MILRKLGRHGFDVSAIGLGCGPLGAAHLDEGDVERLVLGAVDLGITLFDTAPSYGLSESRLGRVLAPVRSRIVLSTKLGYGVEGIPDWTGPCIAAGVDAALRRLRTDRLDIAHLHSCPSDVLTREDVLSALEDAVRAGKVRVAAYSGDGDGLRSARRIALFGAFQVSHNLVDQEAMHEGFPEGAGVIGKRTLLNAAFSAQAGSTIGRPDLETYRSRWESLPRSLRAHDSPVAMAVRFAAYSEGLCSCLVGTTRLENLRACVEAFDQGPLPVDLARELRAAWLSHRWPGMI